MEWLGQSINSSISSGIWSPIRLSRSSLSLSHLFFTDDLVIFGKADEHQATLIKDMLDTICGFFGHWVNAHKTNIFFQRDG